MSTLMAMMALAALAACGGNGGNDQPAGASTAGPELSGGAGTFAVKIDLTCYEFGKPGGALVKQLEKVFQPKKWRGETDGPVLLDAASVSSLTEDQKNALRTVLKNGHAILATGVTQEQLARLHALNASSPAMTLAEPAELYVLGAPLGRLRMLAVRSVPALDPSADRESLKDAYAELVADWYRKHVRATFETSVASSVSATAEDTGDYDKLGSDPNQFPWSQTEVFSMPAYYSNHCAAKQQCIDTFAVTAYAWSLYTPISAENQSSDYVLMRVSAAVNTAGCAALAIGKDNRFAGYWLSQANVSASIPDSAAAAGTSILTGYSAPQATVPDTQYSTGITWNFGVSGTIGSSAGFSGTKPTGEVSKSLGFSAGVSYSNTKTYQAAAIATYPQIGSDPTNPSKVLWKYDSWQHVTDNLKPGNHACGGPGLLINSNSLPPVIYGAAFEPSQEWVWALDPDVRGALSINNDGVPVLPVNVDVSMLLGFAYYWDMTQCNYSGSLGTFNVAAGKVDIVGDVAGDPSNGLVFDTGCGTTTNWGHIPLNGTPRAFTLPLSVPLAPDPRPMQLLSIEPKEGPAGTTITLRGVSLQTVHSMSFGGQPPDTSAMEWPAGTDPATGKRYEAYITVTAPWPAIPDYDGTQAAISVSNAVRISGGTENFVFTYRQKSD